MVGTVHIVDDDPAVRRSLKRLLHSAGFATMAYESASTVLDAAAGMSVGCLLLDVRMPGMDGIELLSLLNERGSHPPVIMMTGHGDVQMAVRAMKAGAVDFIEKPFSHESLLAAIEAALARPSRTIRGHEVAEASGRIAALSRREREVLDALVAGRSNKAIAHDLGISVRTVEVHRAHMLERLRTRSLAEAVRLMVMSAQG